MLLAACAAVPVFADGSAANPDVDYVRDVKPLLVQHCSICHGADKQQAGLRLDTAALAIQGGDSGPAIVPGNSTGSRLIAAVTGTSDVISRMPLEKPPLAVEEIDLLRRWIDQGAEHPADEVAEKGGRIHSDHWAFQPIVRPPVPLTTNGRGLRNGVDAFIQARLEAEGLQPSAEAERATLLRRIYLDLLGMVPPPHEVEQFLAEDASGAYERLVERVFASPHYGERWGRHWLDAARYADSNGFTIDGPRTMWPYRDWVITALNADMPFDEFTVQQLAGDLLPQPTTDQLIATGFHRNTLANEEGGTDDEQFRTENVVDRVSTTGTVWLGLTIGCAQCHDHKFDPLTQRDFYRMFAVFNNTADSNDTAGLAPKLELPTPGQAAERTRLETELAATEQRKQTLEQALLEQMSTWEAGLSNIGEVSWHVVPPVQWTSKNGAEIVRLDDDSLLVQGTIPEHDVYEVQFRSPLSAVSAIRLEVLPDDSLPMRGPGLAANGNFVLTEVELFVRPEGTDPAADEAPFRQSLADTVADHSQENYPVAHALDGDLTTGWAINVSSGSMNVRRVAAFVPPTPIPSTSGQTWTFRLRHETPLNKGYQIGRLRLAVTGAPAESLLITDAVRQILSVEADQRTADQREQLKMFYLKGNIEWRDAAGRVDDLKKQRAALSGKMLSTLIMKELDQPRETCVLIRGDFLRRGAPVAPGVPAVLPPLPEEVETVSRLDLAQWLVDPQNPLTARVIVNRTWQRFFGVGLVETENDFGTQGTPPTHPELLDWLASELMRSNWSMKALQRLIVTSATYRQSSHFRDDLAVRDPRNRFLGRQARVRLEAEVIRDVCLSASGLLSEKIGGAPVHPPQPEGIYVFTQNAKPWKESEGEDRYRRGLYTQFWRSSPHPMMPTFDAPDANSACTRRVRSNTPLQALTLANDRGFMEFAQGLAVRVLREAPAYDTGRMRYAFQCVVGREPTDAESQRLLQFLQAQRDEFARNTERAKEASPANLPEGTAPEEAAAWVGLSRVLLNLDEFITRE